MWMTGERDVLSCSIKAHGPGTSCRLSSNLIISSRYQILKDG
uniref:Uncharacterized protein n=1 Tax=Anguilla anguilla TaxID=7936 RepID=A0A0E9RHG8_ANGAN